MKLSTRDLTEGTLTRTGLEDVADESTDSLNVSQQKRLEIARAVASEPSIIMTDEIVAGLNPAETNGILQILTELNRSGITLIFVEHDVRAVLLVRSEEHTSELQSLMSISYAVFCLKKKKTKK